MIVLRITQSILRFVGLQFNDTNQRWYKFYRVVCIIILGMMWQPQLSTMLSNLDDLIKATDVFIQLSAESMSIVKALLFMYNWRNTKWLLETLQSDLNNNKTLGRSKYFIQADQEAEFVVKLYNRFLLAAGVSFTLGPLAIILFNYFSGTLTPDMWIHPFKADFLFDYTSTPGYEFAYFLNIIYNLFVASYYAAIDTYFVGLCVYSMAYLEDFLDRFMEINNEFVKQTNRISSKTQKYRKATNLLQRDLCVLVQYHYKIERIIDNISTLMTGIIFTQFCGVVFTLSTIAYQITLSNDGTVLIYMGPCVAVLLQLFMYCYYGHMLSHKGLEVGSQLYQSNWYMFPNQYQPFIGLMMARMQRPILMTGFGVVISDIPTFVAILRSVASVLTLFQSIQE